MTTWEYAEDARLRSRNYRWWRDGLGQEALEQGEDPEERLKYFFGTRQQRIPENDAVFSVLFMKVVRQKPVIEGLELESWKACFAYMMLSHARHVRDELAKVHSEHYRQLIKSLQRLQGNLAPFEKTHWAEVHFEIRSNQSFTLNEFTEWAESELASRGAGGRPEMRVLEQTVEDLLILYTVCFGRKASRLAEGPTWRFVAHFFQIFWQISRDEFQAEINIDARAHKRGMSLLRPTQGSLQAILRKSPRVRAKAFWPGWMLSLGLTLIDETGCDRLAAPPERPP